MWQLSRRMYVRNVDHINIVGIDVDRLVANDYLFIILLLTPKHVNAGISDVQVVFQVHDEAVV